MSVTALMNIKLWAMLKDGTYAEERLELWGVVGFPNDFPLELKPA
jgi:hypothetical protein